MTRRPRGRPPKGQQAMTNAERQRAYRQRIADESISLLSAIATNNEKTRAQPLDYAPKTWSETMEEIQRLRSER